MAATHGLVAQGTATIRFINANRRDVSYGNVGLSTTLFEAGGVRPELSRLQWNPRQSGPTYAASIRYRDQLSEPPQSGGGAGPHLRNPENLTYLLRYDGEVRSFITPASDEQEPYELPLTAADFAWLNGLPSGAEVEFAIINSAAWGARDTDEAFEPVPEISTEDHLEGTAAMGLEVPELGLRYFSLNEDVEIGGKTWIGTPRLAFRDQSISTTGSKVAVDVQVGPEQIPDRGAMIGNDVILRFWHRKNGMWIQMANTFPGKIAHAPMEGLVMTVVIDPGPYPRTIDQRRFSHEDQQDYHPGDLGFEHIRKWQSRPQDFDWPFYVKPIPASRKETTLLTTRPVPQNQPPFVNDFDILLPPSPISTTPLRYASVRTALSIHDPEGDRTTVKWVDPNTNVVTEDATITTSVGTHTLSGNAILSTRTTAPESDGIDSVTIAVVDPDGSGDEVRQTGTVRAPNRAYTRILCPSETPTLFFTAGQQDVEVDIAALARYDSRFGFRLLSLEIPAEHSSILSRELITGPVALSGRGVRFDVGHVTNRTEFQVVWTAQHVLGDTDPTVCRINVVINPDQAFAWSHDEVSYTVRQPEADADVPDHTVYLDGLSIPRSGNTYRIKTAPDALKAAASIDNVAAQAKVDFVDPYPFPDPRPANYEGDTFSMVIAGRREIPSGADASLPLYAESDLTVNYTVLPAGATLSGNACEITVEDGHDSADSPYEFRVGVKSSLSIDARDLIHPTVGGGAIRFPSATASIQIIETHSDNPEIWSLSFDDEETPGIVDISGSGLGSTGTGGTGTGWFRVKNRLCPDSTAVTVYLRGETRIVSGLWPQKVVPTEGGAVFGNFGWLLRDHWGIPATTGNLRERRHPGIVNLREFGQVMIIEMDKFVPLLGPGVSAQLVKNRDPQWGGGDYDATIHVALDRATEVAIGKRRMFFYRWGDRSTWTQDILFTPFAQNDIIEAPAVPGAPYVIGEGFIGGIVEGGVEVVAGGQLESRLADLITRGIVRPVSITLPGSAMSTWVIYTEGLVSSLASVGGNAVFTPVGGVSAGGSIQGGAGFTITFGGVTQFEQGRLVANEVNRIMDVFEGSIRRATEEATRSVMRYEFGRGLTEGIELAGRALSGAGGFTQDALDGVIQAIISSEALRRISDADAAIAAIRATVETSEYIADFTEAITRAEGIIASAEAASQTAAIAGNLGAVEAVGRASNLTSGVASTTVQEGETIHGVASEGARLDSAIAVPSAAGADFAVEVVRSVWSNIGALINLAGWLRTWNTVVSKAVETQALRFHSADPNIFFIRGIGRTGLLAGDSQFTLTGYALNPGETIMLATGIVNGKPWKNAFMPVILRSLNPLRDWRDD